MALDLTSLRLAIAQTDEALEFCRSDLAKDTPRLALHLRAAAIQAFEFTYELSYKTLKRYLEETEPHPASVEEMSFNDLIRRAYEAGLLQAELSEWRVFRKQRGTTSHTYDESKAQDVFDGIPDFLKEARFLLNEIERRQSRTA